MEISEFTLKLILLLIPGGISCLIIEYLTIHKRWTSFRFIVNSIFLGAISYLVANLFFNYCGLNNEFNSFWANLNSKEIPTNVILKTSIVSIFLGVAYVAIDNNKWLYKLAQKLRITYKYGDENLYSFLLTSNDVQEVYIRDIENNLTYQGIIDSYSENENSKEILLSNVTVYKYSTSEKLYDMERVYISKPINSIIIEIPNQD